MWNKMFVVFLVVVSGLAYADEPLETTLRFPKNRAAFLKTHPCPATNKNSGPCPGWVVDHIYALCRGGADSSENMQWQTVKDAKTKDRWECTQNYVPGD